MSVDLICVTNPVIDRSHSKLVTASAMSKTISLTTFMDQISSVDLWYFFHPSAKDFSYYMYSNFLLFHCTQGHSYYFFFLITHPHILDLCLPSGSLRHQGGLKLNSSLLANTAFCVSINMNFFLEINRSEHVPPSPLKAFIRGTNRRTNRCHSTVRIDQGSATRGLLWSLMWLF